MRYAVGSVSKQFTATAVVMLAQEGKLSLSDPVSRYVPGLTRGDDVTVRELLSHTSGYQDYWPQDYVMPNMLVPTTAEHILDVWAKKPLDFDPGTQWQYSNTNYVIAGRIIEQLSGMPLMQFLQTRIFAPLGMHSIADVNAGRLGETDAIGYYRHALGPLRPAPKEAAGWLFAAGELAMTAPDLAQWDISLIDRRLLSPAWYDTLTAPVLLKNGTDTHYALGIFIGGTPGHRVWEHSGEVVWLHIRGHRILPGRACRGGGADQPGRGARRLGNSASGSSRLLSPMTVAASGGIDTRVAATVRVHPFRLAAGAR